MNRVKTGIILSIIASATADKILDEDTAEA